MTAVEPSVDASTRNFKVRASLANADGTLRPGTFGRVGFDLGQARDVVVVPQTAISFNPASTVVISLADGRWDGAALGLLAPVLGMLLAVDAYRLLTGREQIACAKLAHNLDGRCIFRCQHPDQARVLALKQMDRQLRARRS